MNDKFFDLKREKQDRMINAGLKVFAKKELLYIQKFVEFSLFFV